MLKQAKHALEQLSADPDARLQAEHREMSLQMWEASAAKGREEGKEEGKEEGSLQAKVSWLLKLLKLKFRNVSPAAALNPTIMMLEHHLKLAREDRARLEKEFEIAQSLKETA